MSKVRIMEHLGLNRVVDESLLAVESSGSINGVPPTYYKRGIYLCGDESPCTEGSDDLAVIARLVNGRLSRFDGEVGGRALKWLVTAAALCLKRAQADAVIATKAIAAVAPQAYWSAVYGEGRIPSWAEALLGEATVDHDHVGDQWWEEGSSGEWGAISPEVAVRGAYERLRAADTRSAKYFFL